LKLASPFLQAQSLTEQKLHTVSIVEEEYQY
jgi:hypothetical protein